MQHLIDQLKDWRERRAEAQHRLTNLQEILHDTKEYAELLKARDHLAYVDDTLKEIDADIRQAAIVEFETTGNKKPAPGISVVVRKQLNYAVTDAIGWCQDHAVNLLKLDKRGFEKHVRATLDTVPLEFVEIAEEPSVRIAKKL